MMTFETDLAAVREVEVKFLRYRCRLLEQLVRDLVANPHDPETLYRARLRFAVETRETDDS